MARKPIPGADDGTWGNILNEFLDISHTATGELRDNIVSEQKLSSAVQTKLNAPSTSIADGAVTTVKLADGAVTDIKIASVSQSKVAGLTSDLASKADAIHTHSLNDLSDVAVAGATEGQVLTLQSGQWGAATISGGNAETPGFIYFDRYFSGADDNAKITAMNTWAQNASGPTPAVLFDARQYNFSTPIKLFSGLKLVGAPLSPAREFSRSTVFNWQGAANTSLFIFPPEGQTGQTYPADGSPRDITVSYIQMQGGNSTHCIQNFDLDLNEYSGHTLWYTQFHACGFKNFKTVWWGWGTGCSISGQTHFQSIIDTALWLAGSENSIFGADSMSLAANSASTWTSTPFIRTKMQKSTIGKLMVTGRKGSTALRIDTSTHNLLVDGLLVDAQDSDPVYGAGIQIRGGDGIVITNCSFKGVSTDPTNASAYGGAIYNKGWIHISGGSQILLHNNMFRRQGANVPATTYPLVYVGSTVGDGQVKWGYNLYSGYSGATATLQQAAADKITVVPDPTVTVTTGA